MTETTFRKLPPMSALEFAIAKTFSNFFFGIALALVWGILMLPLALAAYLTAFNDGLPDFQTLAPMAMASLLSLGILALLASFSIIVNWHRRIILDEKPRRLGWVRLNGVVWKYLLGFLFILAVLAVFAAAGFAMMTYGVPALEPRLGPSAKHAGIAVTVLIGLSALFTWYRLSSWLPAIASGDRTYSLRTAWRSTRRNRLRFLGFTFWLLFSLAIAGAIGAGAFFAQQAVDNPYATAGAFALIGLLAWLALFLIATIATSHYYHFSGKAGATEKSGSA